MFYAYYILCVWLLVWCNMRRTFIDSTLAPLGCLGRSSAEERRRPGLFGVWFSEILWGSFDGWHVLIVFLWYRVLQMIQDDICMWLLQRRWALSNHHVLHLSFPHLVTIPVSGLGGHAGDLGSLRTISTAPGGASLGVAGDDVHPNPLIGRYHVNVLWCYVNIM